MTIFIVKQADGECSYLCGVFATEAKAKENVQTRAGWKSWMDCGASSYPATIEEWEIGTTAPKREWSEPHTNPPEDPVEKRLRELHQQRETP